MSFMAELGDDGQRNAELEVDPTMNAITGGVKVEKKGHQTVIKVQTVMTGLPPVAPMAPLAAPYAASMPWMPPTSPPSTASAPPNWGYPSGYYYPTSTYPDGSQPAATPIAPAVPAAPYGQPAQGQYDYAQYQQYYAQWYQQAGQAPPPTQDTEMG
jgi:hypothetical protein